MCACREAAKSAIINYLHHQNEHKQEEQNQHHQQHHFVESQQQSLRLSTNSVFKCAHGTPDAAPR